MRANPTWLSVNAERDRHIPVGVDFPPESAQKDPMTFVISDFMLVEKNMILCVCVPIRGAATQGLWGGTIFVSHPFSASATRY